MNSAFIALLAISSMTPAMAGTVANEQPSLTDIVEARAIDSVSISPDGKRVAYRVIERSIAENRTMERWFVVSISSPADTVEFGGAIEPLWVPLFDFVEDGDAQWDSSSSGLYVRRRTRAGVQVHKLGPNGFDEVVTDDAADVVSFQLTPDGRTIRYQTRNPRSTIAQLQESERRSGIHLDRTLITDGLPLTRNFSLGESSTNLRRVGAAQILPGHSGEIVSKSIELVISDTGAARATDLDKRSLDRRFMATKYDAQQDLWFRLKSRRVDVSLKQVGQMSPLIPAPVYQVVTRAGRRGTSCPESFCRDFYYALREVLPNEETGEVVVLHEANEAGRSVLYGWNPATGVSRTIYDKQTFLSGGSSYTTSACPRAGRYLICVEAGATKPAELVRIDISTGAQISLAAPNAKLAKKAFAPARYIEWTDAVGRPANGVLFEPPGEQVPRPLIITTYRCRGFLRGGTGDVAPEQMLVQAGFVTLCVNTRSENYAQRDAKGKEIPLGVHKASIESYRSVIELLSRQRIVDPQRVGISGHSYSSNVIAYALSHSDLFSTAVLGTGITIDPSTYYLTAPVPDSWRKGVTRAMSLPNPTNDPTNLWADISPALNAQRIKASVLMLPPESEYLFGMQLYTAIRDAGGVADMYIFPGEGHSVGREPVHQYWRNRRALDWFSFWLFNRENTHPGSDSQFLAWRKLRAIRAEAAN